MEIMDKFDKKRYRKKMTIFWWTRQFSYLFFIAREMTSLAVAFSVILLIFMIRTIAQGNDPYQLFLEKMGSPIFIVLNFLAFGGLVFHSITWFKLTGKAMVVRIGKTRIPPVMITLINLVGWIVISAIFIVLILLYQ